MKNSNNLIASIVICTFNRADLLSDCLNHIEKLKYPKKNYEIIVVIDGSTDDTLKIAKNHKVRIIKLDQNKGISFARNEGLNASRGKIIIFLDDDCIISPTWLNEIIKPFNINTVIGVGGRIMARKKNKILERYLENSGYGNPAPIEFRKSTSPFIRFLAYIKSMYGEISIKAKNITEVHVIYGANSAYIKENIIKINGFDEGLKSSEDTELSSRLIREFPNFKLIYAPKAIAYHWHSDNLFSFIFQTFLRSEDTLMYYKKENKTLPIFPFPILIYILLFIFLFNNLIIFIFMLIFMPQICYSWWVFKAVKERNIEFLYYPYIQLSIETASILGIIKGIIKSYL